jgi:hypothetical protein
MMRVNARGKLVYPDFFSSQKPLQIFHLRPMPFDPVLRFRVAASTKYGEMRQASFL